MQSIKELLGKVFTGDGREQVILAGITGLGLAMAVIALVFFPGDSSSNVQARENTATATSTQESTATATPTSTSAPTETATATGTPASRTAREQPLIGADGSSLENLFGYFGIPETEEVTQAASGTPRTPTPPPPTSTPAPQVSNLSYCDTSGSGNPPTGSVLGLVTIGGATAPAGTIVYLAFDGAIGPSEAVTIEDGKAGYSINYNSGGTECANQAGAAISVVINGQSFSTGQTVGGGTVAFLFNVDLP